MGIDIRSEEAVIELTRDLVRIPSTNPTRDEARCGEYVEAFLRDQGLPAERIPIAPNRFNVVSRLPGGGGPAYVMLAHIDTVPEGEGWQRDPFAAEVEGGRLHGRGSCDMKGGVAAMLVAFARLAREKSRLSGDLVIAAVVDEEGPFMQGAHALVKAGVIPGNAYIMATEPSDCELAVAHKGVAWYALTVRGASAHAANPGVGADANRALAEAMVELYAAARRLTESDPQLGAATCVVSRIEGGHKTNVVSGLARAEVDFRFPPPLTPEQVEGIVNGAAAAAVARVPGTTFELGRLSARRPAHRCDPASPLIAAFDHAHREVAGAPLTHKGFLAYTDAAMAAVLTGSSHCVIYGPGSLTNAHTSHEFVEIAELQRAVAVLQRAATLLLA